MALPNMYECVSVCVWFFSNHVRRFIFIFQRSEEKHSPDFVFPDGPIFPFWPTCVHICQKFDVLKVFEIEVFCVRF